MTAAYASLPVDPEGWCTSEKGEWQHTAMCAAGVEFGHERLCEAYERWDRQHPKRTRGWEERLIAEYESEARFGWAVDSELEARRYAAARGGEW